MILHDNERLPSPHADRSIHARPCRGRSQGQAPGARPRCLPGTTFLFANLLAGVSALAAGRLARRIGLVNTTVFAHLPPNVLLILVPLMPDVSWAGGVLLVRFSISQMDVPTRPAYMMAVVQPDERSAAAGITGVARSAGASLSPMLATVLVGSAGRMSVPFFLAGGLKVVYDVVLYRAFSGSQPKAETQRKGL